MHVPSIFDNARIPLVQKKKRRGPRISPLAAGIAGGSAVAIVAYKRRGATNDHSPVSAQESENGDLARHVSDMIALDQEMAKSIRKQLEGDVVLSVPQSRPILERSASAYEQQASDLEIEAGGGGGIPSGLMKKFLAAVAGAMAPVLGASRTEAVSRLLRDDAVGLRLAAISSSMLHTAAKAEGDANIARIAKEGGETFSQLAEELEGVLPDAVTMEYEQRHDQAPDPSTVNDSADQVDLAFAPSEQRPLAS